MTDDEIRSVLTSRIPGGATERQVESTLDEMGVSRKYRMHYAATESRPKVILARLYEPGGPWLHTEDDDVQFVDVSFVFEPADHLSRTLLFRDRIRYFQREPITGPTSPKRALMKPLGRFPMTIPPPVDPVKGAQ